MNGSLYTWSSISSYFASYLKHNGNPDLKLEDTFFLMPCIFLVQYCFMTIGVELGDKIGPRLISLIGVSIIIISYLIMIFTTNFYLVLLAMGIFGLGDGLSNLSVIKNCWKYFPDQTGLVSGIIGGGLGLSSCLLTPLADYVIINPDQKQSINGFYEKDVADNLKKYLYFLLTLFFILGTISVTFTFKYEEENISIKSAESLEYKKIDGINEKKEKIINNEQKGDRMKKLMKGFLSITNLQLFSFCFCGPCKLFFI